MLYANIKIVNTAITNGYVRFKLRTAAAITYLHNYPNCYAV
jgi:hypothetical protein